MEMGLKVKHTHTHIDDTKVESIMCVNECSYFLNVFVCVRVSDINYMRESSPIVKSTLFSAYLIIKSCVLTACVVVCFGCVNYTCSLFTQYG